VQVRYVWPVRRTRAVRKEKSVAQPNSCARDRARPLVVRDDGVVLRDADTGVAKAENRL
jgi:hypothetical protein